MKENWQQQLQTLLKCDLKSLFPLARSMNRKLKFFVGPTNSGKTYNAMSELKKANSGLYLAPLRLLALEGFEELKQSSIEASLITGEEQMINEEASHVCSTIEMLDFDLDVDVAIIDEVQMLEDDDRGWAWVNAIIGCPAKTVIMTGSVNALDAVKKIAAYLDEELEVIKFDIDATIVMSVLELESADGYGRVIVEDGAVKKIVEQKDANEEELAVTTANAGIYQFDTKFLLDSLPKLSNDNAQKEYYITDLVEMAINQGLVLKPLTVNEENFKGVNSKLDLAEAEIIHQNRIKKQFLLQGVIMRLPDTIYIEEGVEIEGESILENGVTLLGNSKIINSHIKTNTVIEDAILIDSDAGPMARVRPGSEIIGTHLGNFVETKKAKLNGVKAGHLTYLGDCEIDEGTNIGCGTITCNYDGINKYKTIIGKNVFVGSDTQFVAPVTVEDDVLIGAGSTVTGNVKKGELFLTRAAKKIVSGYFYKHFGKK